MLETSEHIHFVESLPDTCVAIRVRVGPSPNKLETCALLCLSEHIGAFRERSSGDTTWAPLEVLDLQEMARVADLEAANAGWPHDNPCIRLHPMTLEGKQLRTYQKTWREPSKEEKQSGIPAWAGALASMVDRSNTACLAMMQEARRSMAVLSDALVHREEVGKELMEVALTARFNEVQAQQTIGEAYLQSVVNELEAETRAAEGDEALKGEAIGLLRAVLGKLGIEAPAAVLPIDELLDDDEVVDQVVAHPKAAEALQRAMERAAERNGEEGEDHGE